MMKWSDLILVLIQFFSKDLRVQVILKLSVFVFCHVFFSHLPSELHVPVLGKLSRLHGIWVERFLLLRVCKHPGTESGTGTAVAKRDRQTSRGGLMWHWHRLEEVSKLASSANIMPSWHRSFTHLPWSGQMCCCWGRSNGGNSVVGRARFKLFINHARC